MKPVKNTTTWDMEFIYKTVCDLAAIAVAQQNKLTTEIKPDNSIVTQADKMVELAAIKALSQPENDTYVIGEETIKDFSKEQLKTAIQGTSYILDPIDGTVPYSCSIPVWGVSLGFAKAGKLLEGCIVLPATHEVMITNGGKTYYGKGTSSLPDFDQLTAVSPTFKENCEHPSRVFVISQLAVKTKIITGLNRGINCYYSIVFPFIYLALGRLAGIYCNFHVWDGAAGFPILRNLGFYIAYEDGEEVSFDIQQDFDFSDYQQGRVPTRKPVIMSSDTTFAKELLSYIQ